MPAGARVVESVEQLVDSSRKKRGHVADSAVLIRF